MYSFFKLIYINSKGYYSNSCARCYWWYSGGLYECQHNAYQLVKWRCLVFFSSDQLFGRALKGWSVLYPRFKPAPAVDGYQIAVLFFLTVLPYTVATIIPSWRAATVDPDAAMRS